MNTEAEEAVQLLIWTSDGNRKEEKLVRVLKYPTIYRRFARPRSAPESVCDVLEKHTVGQWGAET